MPAKWKCACGYISYLLGMAFPSSTMTSSPSLRTFNFSQMWRYYGGRWFASAWPPEFKSLDSESHSPSSALHELYPIIIAAILWGHEWSRKSILIHSDNTAVVEILNKGRSHSLAIMEFLRRLTLFSAQHQFILWAAHVPGHHNITADSLSCFLFQKFKHLARESDLHPTPIPPFSATIFN